MTSDELRKSILAELHSKIKSRLSTTAAMELAGLRRQTLYGKNKRLTTLEAMADALDYKIEFSYKLKKQKGR